MNELVGLVNAFASAGPLGLAILAILAMAFFVHKTITSGLQARIDEHKDDKTQLVGLVKSNTDAISSNTNAVQNCTSAIQQNTLLVQKVLDKN